MYYSVTKGDNEWAILLSVKDILGRDVVTLLYFYLKYAISP